MKFSQRVGIAPVSKLAQRESLDDELRNALWSLLLLAYWSKFQGRRISHFDVSGEVRGSNFQELMYALWLDYFKKPIDTIDRYWLNCLEHLRNYFFEAKWYEAYDFIEFVANRGDDDTKNEFTVACNSHLERENSAYRFVNGKIAEVTSQEEIDEVEDAATSSVVSSGVRTHLTAALRLMSDRQSPDYRNSIKESISAVEALAKQWAKNDSATLGVVLKTLETSGQLHPALKTAFSALYGYTNDAEGIRHALMAEPNLTKADARFMLVCCSAFINYAIAFQEAA